MIVIMALATTVGTGNVNMHADMGTKMLRLQLQLHEGKAFEAKLRLQLRGVKNSKLFFLL